MKKFLTSESGAVTIDWVVLTAGLVGLGLAIGSAILPSINAQSERIARITCEGDTNNPTGLTYTAATATAAATCA